MYVLPGSYFFPGWDWLRDNAEEEGGDGGKTCLCPKEKKSCKDSTRKEDVSTT